MNKNKISRKLLAVLMALCVIFAYTGFAFAGTEGEDTTTPETGTEVTETVVEDEPVEGTEEPVVEETTEDTEEPVVEETPAPKAKKASKKAKSSLSLLGDGDEGGDTSDVITFEPKTPNPYGGDHNVTMYVNGTNGIDKTIYCLQQEYVWPDQTIPYVKGEGFLSSEQMAVIQKILYAGYPYNAAGIFAEEDLEYYGLECTQEAIWAQLADWNKIGNSYAVTVEEIIANVDEYEELSKLLAFANQASIKNETEIEFTENNKSATSGKLTETTDGKWKSEELKIVDSENYHLTYTLTTTGGVTAVDANGKTIDSIKGNESFYLVSDSGKIEDNAGVTATATVKYPTDLEVYVTDKINEAYDEKTNSTTYTPYQTMLCVGEATKSLDATFTVTIDKPDTGDKDPEDNPTTPPGGGNTNPPAIGPTPTPSLPTVTPDGDGTDTPAIPEDPSDDEMDSDVLGNGGADTIDDEDDSIDGDPMGDPDTIDDEEDVDADALGVKTGDASDMIPWTVGFTAALLGLFVALKVRRREN